MPELTSEPIPTELEPQCPPLRNQQIALDDSVRSSGARLVSFERKFSHLASAILFGRRVPQCPDILFRTAFSDEWIWSYNFSRFISFVSLLCGGIWGLGVGVGVEWARGVHTHLTVRKRIYLHALQRPPFRLEEKLCSLSEQTENRSTVSSFNGVPLRTVNNSAFGFSRFE